MANVGFRRGPVELYKDRWAEYLNGNQEFSYLKNALYFATDVNAIYLDGSCYTFQGGDVEDFISGIDYDASENSITIDYADIEKEAKKIYLNKVVSTDSNIIVDSCILETGQIVYNLKLSDKVTLSGNDISTGIVELTPDASGNIDDSFDSNDSVATSITKIVNQIGTIKTDSSSANEEINENITNLETKTDVQVVGEGDFVSSVVNDADSSCITVYKQNIADAYLTGYDTSTGCLDENNTINSAVQNLDESLTWQTFYETETE